MKFYMPCDRIGLLHLLRMVQKRSGVLTFNVVDQGSNNVLLDLRVNHEQHPTRVILMADGTWTLETVIEVCGDAPR